MSDDYVTDITYHRSFLGDLAPARLRLAAALNGFRSPASARFVYCELGCAHGDTLALLAAANPAAHFIGVDLNAEHIDSGRRTAQGASLENLRFLEADFEALDDQNLPELDFVCAHGVLSWIAPEKRKAVLDFASRKLKPGGLLYVGYNALPGWASVEPLRHLLMLGATRAEGGVERARLGFALAKHLHDAGAVYFASNPSAANMLRKMEQLGLPYIAHEYLNAHWVPMYFSQVAQEMADVDLYFAGQLPLYVNYRDLVLPPAMAKQLESVGDRATFEILKDFFINEFFRRDVYIKGRVGRSEEATQSYFDASCFGLAPPLAGRDPATAPPHEVRLPHGSVTLDGPLFQTLFAILARGAARATALFAHPELARFGGQDVRAALLRAVITECVLPVSGETRTPPVSKDALFGIPLAYNRMIVAQGSEGQVPLALASPLTGNGVVISPLEVRIMRQLTGMGGGAEEAPLLESQMESFRRHRLAQFVEWGILECPSH